MNEVKVLKDQTLVDIAIQELGDVTRVMEIATLNEMNLTDTLQAGQMLSVPDFDITKRNEVAYFRNTAFRPASGITEEDESVGEGIGFWYIETDFVVQ